MMLRTDKVIVVEGKYDEIKLSSIIDAPIIKTDGFGIFKDREKQSLIQRLAKKRGLIILTDGDSAGFMIRNFLGNKIPEELITHVYIPDLYGKEKRKAKPSSEGKLGVEGVPKDVIISAFERAGITELKENSGLEANSDLEEKTEFEANSEFEENSGLEASSEFEEKPGLEADSDLEVKTDLKKQFETEEKIKSEEKSKTPKTSRQITGLDFYEDGVSGKPESKEKRKKLLKALELPEKMSTTSLLKIINLLITYDEYKELVNREFSENA